LSIVERGGDIVDVSIRLRPVVEEDLAIFRRFATEPDLTGQDWTGFTDAQAPARRFAADSYLGADSGRLMVEVEQEKVAAGFVSWALRDFGGPTNHWEIGIALLRDGYLYSRLRDDPSPL
jgi:ribosomal-protein-alanine N-acetyltransferase